MILKNRLKELRARDGLNQSELAKLAGVSRQSISLLERGEYTPSVIIAITIAQIFKEPVENVFSLVEGEEEYEKATTRTICSLSVLEKCRYHYSFRLDRRSYRIFDRNVWIRKAPRNPILL